MTALAVSVSGTVIKSSWTPSTGRMTAGTLSGIVIGWAISGVTALAVCICGAVVKSSRTPSTGRMAAGTLTGIVVGWPI